MINRDVLKNILLLRIATGGERGATVAEMRRDIEPFVSHIFTDTEWQETLDKEVTQIAALGYLQRAMRGRLLPDVTAIAQVQEFLGGRLAKAVDWPFARNVYLVAVALGMAINQATRMRALVNAEGLRMAVLEHAYGLHFSAAGPSTAELRNALAEVAIRRGLVGDVEGFEPGGASREKRFTPAFARSLAACLAKQSRVYATDTELISQLTAEQVGASRNDPSTIRLVVVQRMLGPAVVRGDAMPGDLAGFAQLVLRIAVIHASGWAGNRRCFISEVWGEISRTYPNWGLAEETFKELLIDAHRSGFLTLANADLREASELEQIAASAVSYKNTEWHYIRVSDTARQSDAAPSHVDERSF